MASPQLHSGVWVEHTNDGRWFVTMNARRVREIRGSTPLRDIGTTTTIPDNAQKRQPDSRVGKLIRKGSRPELIVQVEGERGIIDLPDKPEIPFKLIANDIRPHLKPCPTPK